MSWPGEDPPVKISSFSSHCRKSHKSIDLILFIVRVQFLTNDIKNQIRKQHRILPNLEGQEETSLKRCEKKGASKESIAHKGLQSIDGRHSKKHLRICFLQAQRTFLTAFYIRYSSARFQTRAAKRSLTLMLLKQVYIF